MNGFYHDVREGLFHHLTKGESHATSERVLESNASLLVVSPDVQEREVAPVAHPGASPDNTLDPICEECGLFSCECAQDEEEESRHAHCAEGCTVDGAHEQCVVAQHDAPLRAGDNSGAPKEQAPGDAASTNRQGCFVSIPLAGESADAGNSLSVVASPKSILVVDDDLRCAGAVARLLKLRGFDVTVSSVAHDPKGFDCCVTDYQPSGPDQIRLCREADVPVLVLTGSAEAVRESVSVVEKPASVEDLVTAIRAELNSDAREEPSTFSGYEPRKVAPHFCSICRSDACTSTHACE